MSCIAHLHPGTLFDRLEHQQPDALLAVIGMHRADPRPDKIDVGVGIYRDADGATPVMAAVKTAEGRLLGTQQTKGYLGAEGDHRFTDLLAAVSLGPELATDPRISGVQTPGGTGALRLAADLIGRTRRESRVWVGIPTWPNHAPILRAAGLQVRCHAWIDAATQEVDFDALLRALGSARAGDVVLLHGCCHNPTGASLSAEQWATLTATMVRRGLVPLVDLAYQGLGRGMEEDAAGARAMLAAVPEGLLAYSCDKNFALYRERVGALWVKASNEDAAAAARGTMLMLARSLWSMPPDHGAAVVRTILEDARLGNEWQLELDGMRERIISLREALGRAHPALAPIARQDGLFALLPISADAVKSLRERNGIYMPDSGRMNVAGLREDTVARFVAAIAPHLAN